MFPCRFWRRLRVTPNAPVKRVLSSMLIVELILHYFSCCDVMIHGISGRKAHPMFIYQVLDCLRLVLSPSRWLLAYCSRWVWDEMYEETIKNEQWMWQEIDWFCFKSLMGIPQTCSSFGWVSFAQNRLTAQEGWFNHSRNVSHDSDQHQCTIHETLKWTYAPPALRHCSPRADSDSVLWTFDE